MTSRIARWLLIAFVVASSCALPRPGVELTIAGTSIPGSREGSYCQSGGCSGVCADSIAPTAPLTRVSAGAPLVFEFSTGGEVNEIRASMFPGDELHGQAAAYTIDLAGAARRHTVTAQLSGHYYIVVMIRWSRLTDSGDTSRVFRVDIA